MQTDFQCTTSGKWILTGEHGVLRGHPILLFPLREKTLTLRYDANNNPLSYYPSGLFNPGNMPLIISLIDCAMQLLPVALSKQLTGTLYINNQIPVRAGMGASAALCVALSRWLYHLTNLPEDNLQEYARRLEDFFHGKSSGGDVAVTLAKNSIEYQMGRGASAFNPIWQPNWYLSFSGTQGNTSECVAIVERYWRADALQAQHIDEKMRHSVMLAKSALLSPADPDTLARLKEAIELGKNCFVEWGLLSSSLEIHCQDLAKAGAIATKPTGSGLGGHVLSLWENPPSAALIEQLGLISLG